MRISTTTKTENHERWGEEGGMEAVLPSADLGDSVWVFDESCHHQLPAELLAGVSKVRERGPHERRPEDDGQVAGGHLVEVSELLDAVEVEEEVVEGGEVGGWHVLQDRLQLSLLF